MIYLNIVFEDALSESVILKILKDFNGKFNVAQSFNANGFGYIKSNIRGFNEGCKAVPFLVLTDLDNYECPIALMKEWLKFRSHPNLIFRVAVKEIEAWLLGDTTAFSRYSRTPIAVLPQQPELELDPKKTLIKLVDRYSSRQIKEDIVPIGTASIGRNYNSRLMEFVNDHWVPSRAMDRCQSLRKMYTKLDNFII